MYPCDPDGFDDIDRLLSRTVPVPPLNLEGTVQRRIAVARRSGRLLLALAAYLLSILLLAVLGVLLGRATATGGARDLLTLALEDAGAVRAYPREYGAALAAAIPWLLVFALATDTLLVAALTRYLLRATDAPPRSRGVRP